VPALDFAPPDDMSAMQAAIQQVGEQDWLIFISKHAVIATVPALRAAWPVLPERVKFAAVGAATVQALKSAGYLTTLTPEAEWSSEGLLAQPVMHAVINQNIMIMRGQGGREYLEKELSARGANVLSCIAYQRILPDTDTAVVENLLQRNLCAAIIAGSFETITNFKLLIDENNWPRVLQTPLIVMSERIKKLAAEMGFQTIWVTQQASTESILNLISEKKDVLCQRTKK